MPRRPASPHARVSGVKYNSPDGDAYGADVLTTGRAPGWPAPRPETIDLIRDRGVTCAGTDGLSIGPAEGGAPTHLTGLPHGVTMKALGGLGPGPAAGAWFLFLPLRLADGTGSPRRASVFCCAAFSLTGRPLGYGGDRRVGLVQRLRGSGGGIAALGG